MIAVVGPGKTITVDDLREVVKAARAQQQRVTLSEQIEAARALPLPDEQIDDLIDRAGPGHYDLRYVGDEWRCVLTYDRCVYEGRGGFVAVAIAEAATDRRIADHYYAGGGLLNMDGLRAIRSSTYAALGTEPTGDYAGDYLPTGNES